MPLDNLKRSKTPLVLEQSYEIGDPYDIVIEVDPIEDEEFDSDVDDLYKKDGKKAKLQRCKDYLELDYDCPICLEKLNKSSCYLICKHAFHVKCIQTWL